MAAPQFAMFIGVLFGVLPAMALLYYMLDRYEGFFEDKRIFLFLVFGFVAGGFVTTIQVGMRFAEPAYLLSLDPAIALLLVTTAFPAMEAGAKTVILNWHTVRNRRDAPFYAVPLGLGFGAVATFIVVARGVAAFSALPNYIQLTHPQLIGFYLLLLELFLGGIMIHAFSATIINELVQEGSPVRGWLAGAALTMPFYVGYYIIYGSGQGAWTIIVPTFVLLYGVFGVRYTITKILDGVVPEEMARKVRREIRRQKQSASSK